MKCINMKKNKFKEGQDAYLVYSFRDAPHVCYFVYNDSLSVKSINRDEEGYYYTLISGTGNIIDYCREEDLFSSFVKASWKAAQRQIRHNLKYTIGKNIYYW